MIDSGEGTSPLRLAVKNGTDRLFDDYSGAGAGAGGGVGAGRDAGYR